MWVGDEKLKHSTNGVLMERRGDRIITQYPHHQSPPFILLMDPQLTRPEFCSLVITET